MSISYQNRLRYVYKVTSSRIRKANYHLNLTYHEASINGELAAIGNHQVFRFIDQLRSQKRMEEQRGRSTFIQQIDTDLPSTLTSAIRENNKRFSHVSARVEQSKDISHSLSVVYAMQSELHASIQASPISDVVSTFYVREHNRAQI